MDVRVPLTGFAEVKSCGKGLMSFDIKMLPSTSILYINKVCMQINIERFLHIEYVHLR